MIQFESDSFSAGSFSARARATPIRARPIKFPIDFRSLVSPDLDNESLSYMASQIAVLVLDTPISGVAEIFGDFGDNVKDLLKHNGRPLVKYQIAIPLVDNVAEPSDVEKMEATFSKLEESISAGVTIGVVLTGSRSDSYATGNVWIDRLDKFIHEFLFTRPDFPIVGLCFGHQILAKNLGCKVHKNTAEHGWEVGTTTIALNKSIMSIENSPFKEALTLENGQVLEHINLVEFHSDIVYGLPPEPTTTHGVVAETTLQNFGSTNKCSIQGFVTEAGPLKLLTFQGHPEFTTPEAIKMLEEKHKGGLIDTALYERLVYNTKNLINQGPIIAEVVNTFFNTYN